MMLSEDTAGDTVLQAALEQACHAAIRSIPLRPEKFTPEELTQEKSIQRTALHPGPETFGYQAGGPVDADTRKQTYYSENIKKTRQRKTGVGHLILASLISSLLSAGMMFAAVVYMLSDDRCKGSRNGACRCGQQMFRAAKAE